MNYLNITKIDGKLFEMLVKAGADNLKKNIDIVNDLNVFPIPDGDTGLNMSRTINGGIEEMSKTKSDSLKDKAKAISKGMLINARGNSGVILSQLFHGASLVLREYEEADVNVINEALKSAVKTAYEAVKKPVEGTILTVSRESYDKVSKDIKDDSTIAELSKLLIGYMKESLENTPNLLEVLKEAGVVDSGGAGLLFIHEGMDDLLNGKDGTEVIQKVETKNKKLLDFSKFDENYKIKLGYSLFVILQPLNDKEEINLASLYGKLKSLSMNNPDLNEKNGKIEINLNTNDPDKVLSYLKNYGEFLLTKIKNLDVLAVNGELEESFIAPLPKIKKARKRYGILVIANGEGFKEVLKEFGADVIIDGGAGANVSTKDFLDAFEEINADNIFILPNDGNLVMAAELAKKYYEGSNIFVLKTKNPGEVYQAISSLDLDVDDPKQIYEELNEIVKNSTTAMLAQSVRDTKMNGIDVIKGGYIAFDNDLVLTSALSIFGAFKKLAKKLEFENKEFLTLFYGKKMPKEDKLKIKEFVESDYPNIELYELDANQDSYDIILIVE